jgi:hypothetical protein
MKFSQGLPPGIREVFRQPPRSNIAFALFLSENETHLPYPIVSGKEGPHKTRQRK